MILGLDREHYYDLGAKNGVSREKMDEQMATDLTQSQQKTVMADFLNG